MTTERWVIVAPHIDDAEFGMGGYIHRAVVRDKTVKVNDILLIIVANSGYTRSDGAIVTAEERSEEMVYGLKAIMGGDCCHRADLMRQDNHVVCDGDLVTEIEQLITRFAPTEVFIPQDSFNQDHQATHNACMAALRPKDTPIPRLWAYEYPGDHWKPMSSAPVPTWGHCYVRLTEDDLAAKVNGLYQHRTQFNGRSNTPVGPMASKSLALFRGSEVGAYAAERFTMLREVY